MHQIIVALDGWKKVSPVSIDKIGIYFREAMPEVDVTTAVVSCVCVSEICLSSAACTTYNTLTVYREILCMRSCSCDEKRVT